MVVVIRIIEDGVGLVSPELADCMVALAGHHLSLIVSNDPGGHLLLGTRFARLANDLNPTDVDAAFLLEEAQLLAQTPIDAIDDHPASYLPHDQEEAVFVLHAIFDRAAKLLAEGRYRLCVRLYRRGELIIHRAELARSEEALDFQILGVQAMLFAGEHQRALDAVNSLLPMLERVDGKEHSNTLVARQLEAQILDGLGEHRRALDAVAALLPDIERVGGKEHPETLTTRLIEAQIFNSLGEHQRALDAVTNLLPIAERVRGKDHPETLCARFLEAQALNSLGEHRRALGAVTSLLPIEERDFGQEHPRTIITRLFEAQILDRLGEHQRSLEAVTSLLPIFERVCGQEHSNTLAARRILADVLVNCGRPDEALIICRELALTDDASDRLYTDLIESKALAAKGLNNEALRLLDSVIERMVSSFANEYFRIVEARVLRSKITVNK